MERGGGCTCALGVALIGRLCRRVGVWRAVTGILRRRQPQSLKSLKTAKTNSRTSGIRDVWVVPAFVRVCVK